MGDRATSRAPPVSLLVRTRNRCRLWLRIDRGRGRRWSGLILGCRQDVGFRKTSVLARSRESGRVNARLGQCLADGWGMDGIGGWRLGFLGDDGGRGGFLLLLGSLCRFIRLRVSFGFRGRDSPSLFFSWSGIACGLLCGIVNLGNGRPNLHFFSFFGEE